MEYILKPASLKFIGTHTQLSLSLYGFSMHGIRWEATFHCGAAFNIVTRIKSLCNKCNLMFLRAKSHLIGSCTYLNWYFCKSYRSLAEKERDRQRIGTFTVLQIIHCSEHINKKYYLWQSTEKFRLCPFRLCNFTLINYDASGMKTCMWYDWMLRKTKILEIAEC